jgi:predicted CXXCH cytochrome family protein
VIGTAPEAAEGTVQWQGQSTAFRVRDGRFTVTLDLRPGTHNVRFTTKESSLEAEWKIDPKAQFETYFYHPKVTERECQACHEPQSPPEAGTDVAAICGECHSTYQFRRHVHGPVGMGLCAACHDPHGSPRAGFLRFESNELCGYCHNQPLTESHRRTSGDTPCMTCHDPHGTNRPYQLKKSR